MAIWTHIFQQCKLSYQNFFYLSWYDSFNDFIWVWNGRFDASLFSKFQIFQLCDLRKILKMRIPFIDRRNTNAEIYRTSIPGTIMPIFVTFIIILICLRILPFAFLDIRLLICFTLMPIIFSFHLQFG